MATPTNPPPEPPATGGEAPELHPAIPAVVSLFAPGLGLLFLKTRDRVKDALLIFGVWIACLMVCIVLSVVTFGLGAVCCGVPLFVVNIAAAIHSYDEAMLLDGEKPLVFQKGLRIFKD